MRLASLTDMANMSSGQKVYAKDGCDMDGETDMIGMDEKDRMGD